MIKYLKCTKCGEIKSVYLFSRAGNGYQSSCKRCASEYARGWYLRKKKPQKDAAKSRIKQIVQVPRLFNTKDEAAGYLAGIIDGEGSVILVWSERRQLYSNRNIQISNTDRDIIEACASACNLLDITFNIRKYTYTNRRKKNGEPFKPEYRLSINGQINAQIVFDQVPLKCQEKKVRLGKMLETFERVLPRRQQGILTLEDIGEFQHTWSVKECDANALAT